MKKKVIGTFLLAALLIGVRIYFQTSHPEAAVRGNHQIKSDIEKSEPTKTDSTVVSEKTIPAEDSLTSELAQAEKNLPTLEQAKTWSEEEIHGTPVAVMESGKEIGKLIDAAEKNPERREPTLKYFLKCAENKEVLPSVRAVCWKSLTQNIPGWKVFVPLAESEVPESVRILAGKL